MSGSGEGRHRGRGTDMGEGGGTDGNRGSLHRKPPNNQNNSKTPNASTPKHLGNTGIAKCLSHPQVSCQSLIWMPGTCETIWVVGGTAQDIPSNTNKHQTQLGKTKHTRFGPESWRLLRHVLCFRVDWGISLLVVLVFPRMCGPIGDLIRG